MRELGLNGTSAAAMSRIVADRVALGLRTYKQYIVGNAGGLLAGGASAGVVRESA